MSPRATPAGLPRFPNHLKLMETRYSPGPKEYQRLSTAELRARFLLENLFAPGELVLAYSDADRVIAGSAVPTRAKLKLCVDAAKKIWG